MATADDESGLGPTSIEHLYIDAKRRIDGQELGMAQRPERDLRTAVRFAPLREDPWKLTLAVEMAFYARSQDRSSQVWPVDSFLAALDVAGQELPPGVDIHSAIEIVSADLLRCSPATANTDAWFDVNIGRPLGIRLSSSSVGVADVDEFADSGVPGQWLRQDLRDTDLEVLTVLLLDVQAAPDRLRARLDASDDHRDVLEGALVLAERIAADAPSLEAFRLWLRGASDGPSTERGGDLLRRLGIAGGPHADAVVREYLSVLSAGSGSPYIPGERFQ